jgi:hypothetical protein
MCRCANPRFKRFHQRDDIAQIREVCTRDSIRFYDSNPYVTLYNDSWRRPPTEGVGRASAPSVSVHIGGGAFAPNREEQRTHYMNTFHPFRPEDVPALADAPPDSDVIAHDSELPRLSTTHVALAENAGKWAYDRSAASAQAANQRGRHFDVGYDGPTLQSTTRASYPVPGPGDQVHLDPRYLRGSWIGFDPAAGPGPRARALARRHSAPPKPDARPFDQTVKNFDVGHDPPSYNTATGDAHRHPHAKPPVRATAQPCAPRADDGDAAPHWRTNYTDEYQRRAPMRNEIDTHDLRSEHWDHGYDPRQWPVHPPFVPAERREPAPRQHGSNQVFQGDGEMEFGTATRAATAWPDGDSRPPLADEARRDNIYVGCDSPTRSTTARDANTHAGTGRRAQRCRDLHDIRGPMMARRGDWDRFAGDDPRQIRAIEQPRPVDGRWHLDTHWDLEATDERRKGRWGTTYSEEICKPRLDLSPRRS